MVRTVKGLIYQSTTVAPVVGPGKTAIELKINGQTYRVDVEPRRSLLDVLRGELGLTGTKKVCNLGECGACTVLIDGRPMYACLALAVECQGREVLTIEGLATDDSLDPVQDAFVRHDAVQCGFCTPGQIMAAKGLLDANPHPSEAEIHHSMAGNLCRCGTYTHIMDALRELSQRSDEGQG